MEKNIGIWLDTEKAFIITLMNGSQSIKKLESEVEHYHLHGGYGSSTPYGSQDASSEKRLNQRKKQQMKNYYQQIINQLNKPDNVLIFGPAQAKVGLKKAISSNKLLASKLAGVKTADTMTQNQLVAFVRNYFNSKN